MKYNCLARIPVEKQDQKIPRILLNIYYFGFVFCELKCPRLHFDVNAPFLAKHAPLQAAISVLSISCTGGLIN